MFVHRSSAYCQQLGPPEPTLRTTTFCEDQFLHHIPELKRFVPVATRLSQSDEKGQDASFTRSHCTHLEPRGPAEARHGHPAIGEDQLIQTWLKRSSRYIGAVVPMHIHVRVAEVRL